MTTNEFKKGDRIRLRNGWYATIADNMKGNTRMAKVEGFVVGIGNVYSHDIMARVNKDGTETVVEHTAAQEALRKKVHGAW